MPNVISTRSRSAARERALEIGGERRGVLDRVVGGQHRERRVRRFGEEQARRGGDRGRGVAPHRARRSRARPGTPRAPRRRDHARSARRCARAGTSAATRAPSRRAACARRSRAAAAASGRDGVLHGQKRSPRPPARIRTNRSLIAPRWVAASARAVAQRFRARQAGGRSTAHDSPRGRRPRCLGDAFSHE